MKKAFVFALGLLVVNFASAQEPASQISDEQAHEIVMKGTPEDVKKLLQTGYDVNKVYMCNTLLTEAIRSAARGQNARKYPLFAIDKIKILINSGADINLIPCPEEGMPALHWAVALPKTLENLESDANKIIDEKIKNKIGECNFPGIVSKPCGNITAEEKEKIRIAITEAMQLAYRTFTPHFTEIIDFLTLKGANINLKAGLMGITPLHIAAQNPQEISLEPLKYLINVGANLNIQDDDGNTPLFWAYGSNNNKAVDLLIAAGARKDIKNKNGVFYNDVEAIDVRIFIDTNGNLIIE